MSRYSPQAHALAGTARQPLTRTPGLPPDGAEGQFLCTLSSGRVCIAEWDAGRRRWRAGAAWARFFPYQHEDSGFRITSHIPVPALASLPLAHDDASDEVRS